MRIVKKFLSNKILVWTVVLIVIFCITQFILKILNLKFRKWFFMTIAGIATVIIFIELIHILLSQNNKIKLFFMFISIIGIMLVLLFYKKIILAFFGTNARIEHVVEKNSNKYVASVEEGFLDTTVYYYKYINWFIMGSEVEFIENYKGAYDPIRK